MRFDRVLVDENVLFVAVVALVTFVALVILVAITYSATRHIEKRTKAWRWSDEERVYVRTIRRHKHNSQIGLEETAVFDNWWFLLIHILSI
jgi:hypothetical protein